MTTQQRKKMQFRKNKGNTTHPQNQPIKTSQVTDKNTRNKSKNTIYIKNPTKRVGFATISIYYIYI